MRAEEMCWREFRRYEREEVGSVVVTGRGSRAGEVAGMVGRGRRGFQSACLSHAWHQQE